jgi:(hydroxyamino)benzene mutase
MGRRVVVMRRTVVMRGGGAVGMTPCGGWSAAPDVRGGHFRGLLVGMTGSASARPAAPTATAAPPAASAPEQLEAGRHPLDPDPIRSTKSAAVLALGVIAVVTGPVVGGIVPATVGIALARQARNDLIAGRGYLTGVKHLRLGLALAWTGIGLAVAALVVASIVGLISLAGGAAHDFPASSN